MFWKVISVAFLLVFGWAALSLDNLAWNNRVVHSGGNTWIEHWPKIGLYRVCGFERRKGVICREWESPKQP